jgi:uncharacterized SAM-binding protein YcdF (DUF218 family)
MGKLFTEPLFVFIILQIAVVLRYRFKSGGISVRDQKKFTSIFLSLLAGLWLVSMPVVSNLLERSLALKAGRENFGVKIVAIAVLSGGYFRESDPKLDFLSDDSTSRVLHGIEWWRREPDAKLILTGASASDLLRSTTREVELMRDLCIRHGVPRENLILEPTATDTSKHPLAILQIRGINYDTPIGVVTSRWHLRRAIREFKRHFKTVVPYPYEPEPFEAALWPTWVPRRSALAYSTTLIHEWFGLAWYQLTATFTPRAKSAR